ncbi:hypothetical protein BDV12DRAFT_203936 [Aspergillus spectabilis]
MAGDLGISRALIPMNQSPYTWPVVDKYTKAIQDNAAQSVRELLKVFSERLERARLQAIEYTDNGTPLVLRIEIDARTGTQSLTSPAPDLNTTGT